MRGVRNTRHLADREKLIARQVFKVSLPYEQI
jgi:hypothetical protein